VLTFVAQFFFFHTCLHIPLLSYDNIDIITSCFSFLWVHFYHVCHIYKYVVKTDALHLDLPPFALTKPNKDKIPLEKHRQLVYGDVVEWWKIFLIYSWAYISQFHDISHFLWLLIFFIFPISTCVMQPAQQLSWTNSLIQKIMVRFLFIIPCLFGSLYYVADACKNATCCCLCDYLFVAYALIFAGNTRCIARVK
jgi:hypothetical protein